jgi:hypothetical protein
MSYTRVVDEDADATKVCLNLCGHAPHVGGDRHIRLNRDCLPSHPGDFGADCIRSVGTLTVVNGDIGTSLSQCDCDCGPDAATSSSNKSNSIL